MQKPNLSDAGASLHNNFCRTDFDKSLLNDIPLPVYTCGLDGTITYFNKAAADLWGRQPETAIEKWGGAYKIYMANGDAFEKGFNPIANAMQTGVVEKPVEFVLERAEGTLFNVLVHITLIYDEKGIVQGASVMLIDVTEKRKAEPHSYNAIIENVEQKRKLIRSTEDRYQKMIDEVEDYAILMLDRDGYVLNWNRGAKKIKGYSANEIIGEHFSIFYLAEDRQKQLPETLLKYAQTNGRATNEGWRLRKDGTKFWASIVITMLHDDYDNQIGFCKVTRDLTERKFAEDRLRHNARDIEFRNKQLEEYAYIASHDLQEPLRKIQVFSEMLMENIDDKAAVIRYMDKINSSAGRMTTLIKDVLKYSQLSSTEELFDVADLNAILENVLVDFDLLIEQKNVKLTIGKLPVLKGIPIQIHQLFSNLLSNAIKFGGSSPEISITAEPIAIDDRVDSAFFKNGVPYIKILFSDKGQGFEQEYADMIFKMFKRLDNTPGTGIGLALCKKIAENHNGAISAKSEPGVGTTFSIFLPLI